MLKIILTIVFWLFLAFSALVGIFVAKETIKEKKEVKQNYEKMIKFINDFGTYRYHREFFVINLSYDDLKSYFSVRPEKWSTYWEACDEPSYCKHDYQKYLPIFMKSRSTYFMIKLSFDDWKKFIKDVDDYIKQRKKLENYHEEMARECEENKNLREFLLCCQSDIDELLKQSQDEIDLAKEVTESVGARMNDGE